jgi:hypothetical protein
LKLKIEISIKSSNFYIELKMWSSGLGRWT